MRAPSRLKITLTTCKLKHKFHKFQLSSLESLTNFDFYRVDKNEDLKYLERGILIEVLLPSLFSMLITISECRSSQTWRIRGSLTWSSESCRGWPSTRVTSRISSIARRWSSRNRTGTTRCFPVSLNKITFLVSHSRVKLKELPTIIPKDGIGQGLIGHDEQLNLYMNANYINVADVWVIWFRLLSRMEEKRRS